jgi:hypothetical protein
MVVCTLTACGGAVWITPPPAVGAFADRVIPPFDGIVRIDRKVVVQLGNVVRREPPIQGATDSSWAVAVVGEIAQTWGLLPVGSSRCAIWFVDSAGLVFASQRGPTSTCDAYLSGR